MPAPHVAMREPAGRSVTIQMNGSDGNPAAVANAKPTDSWELATPWAMQYYVKGENGRGRSVSAVGIRSASP